MRLIPWIVVPLSLVLLFVAWQLRPSADPRIIARLTAADFVLSTADPLVMIDVDRGRITSIENKPDRLGHGRFGDGGSVMIEYPFSQERINQVVVIFRPLNEFSVDSLVMKSNWEQTTDASQASGKHVSLGRWKSTAELVEKKWTFDRPIENCLLKLPRGTDLQVETIVLSQSETTDRFGLYLLAASLLLPGIVLASSILARRQRVTPKQTMLFGAGLALHAILSLLLAGLGHNFDMDSWEIVANLVNDGKIVYPHTYRWPYGLPAMYLLGGVMQVHDYFKFSSIESFHVLVATALCLVNIAIATYLAVYFDWLAGLLFALLPTGILVTGFHSQIDNLAIAVALTSWTILLNEQRRKNLGWLCLSAMLLSFSLAIKHVMIFFPLCLVFWSDFGRLRERLAFAAAVYLFFFLHFFPMAFDHEVRTGIVNHVFLYRSWHGVTGLISKCINKLTSPALMEIVQDFQVLNVMWLLGICVTAFFCAKKEPRSLMFLYVMAFVAFAPALTDQYLAIPLVACAFFYRHITIWFYVVASTIWLVFSKYNIGGILDLEPASAWYHNVAFLGTPEFSTVFLVLFIASWSLDSCRGAQNSLGNNAS